MTALHLPRPSCVFSKQADITGSPTSHPSRLILTSLPLSPLLSSSSFLQTSRGGSDANFAPVTLTEFLFLSELLALMRSSKAYGPLSGFVNKVLLGRCPTHFFCSDIICGYLNSAMATERLLWRVYRWTQLKHVPFCVLQNQFTRINGFFRVLQFEYSHMIFS